jgi:hypothetical protein
LAKNPKSITLKDESNDKSITRESQSDIYNETLASKQVVTPKPEMVPEQLIELRSRNKPQQKSATEYTALGG